MSSGVHFRHDEQSLQLLLQVTVDKDVLRISVEKAQEKREQDPKVRWHRYERSYSFAGRALRMPLNANMDDIKAK
jgi:hypothetical protein